MRDPIAMTDAERYGHEAEQCRQLARKVPDPVDRAAWLKLAAEWSRLAKAADLRRTMP